MVKVTIFFSAALIVLGVGGYLLSNASASPHAVTALIPAFVGTIMLVAGGIALNPKYRMHAMHVAVLVSTLGFLAALFPAGRMLLGAAPTTTLRLVSIGGMLILTSVYTALCIRSFRAARMQRSA